MGVYANPVADRERIEGAKKALVALGLLALVAVAMAVVAVPAHAQSTTNTITVNSDQDNTANDGRCTLREAITSANSDSSSGDATNECAAGSGTDTINFAISGNGPHTITLGSTLPDITRGSALTIDGQQNRITLSGNNKYRVLAVDHGARLDLNNLTVVDANSGDEDGGGIYNYQGTLNVTNSTFSGNRAEDGGGIYNNVGTLNVSNSTFSQNSASWGGGIENQAGPLTVINSTFFGNTATSGRGGGIYVEDANPTLINTILANNKGSNCASPGTTIIDGGGNLVDADSANDAASCYFGNPTSQTNIPAGLDPEGLEDNGGPTETIALQADSAAVEKGDDANCPETDQRGVSRPQGGGCDIGAFELKIPLTVNSTADSNDGACTGSANGCTLREAINAANASPGADTITFDLGDGSHTITLGSKLPAITDGDGLTMGGGQNQITISGGGNVQVLVVSSGARLDVKNLTVANGDSSGGSGGGIYNSGTLNVTNSTIRDNSAFYSYRQGGGIYNDGTLSVTSSTFSGNSADTGGGISNRGTLSIINSTFSGNSAYAYGGGIYNYQGTLDVTNSTISGNKSSISGGGIYNSGGKATLGNTIVANSIRGGNCAGSITDGGYNLASDATCGFTEASSLSEKDPKLGGLADNGGPTQNHALLEGSPAIDKGKALGTATDQRGETRPIDLANVDNAADGSDIGAFELRNNASPTAAADSYTTDEDAPLTVNASTGVLSNDTDSDTGDTLEAVLVSGPSNVASFELKADGSFSYTPRADYNGPDSFTYKVNDGTDDSNTATVKIAINPLNDAPGFAKGTDQTVNEDAGAQSVTGWATNISAGPSDESSQRVTFSATNDNNALFTAAGQPGVSPDGTLTYIPARNASGKATVTVKATDDGGTANGGVDTSAAKTFTITVNPVNDTPTVEVAAGGQCSTSGTGGRINLIVNDVESAPSALSLSATSSNQSLVPNSGLSVGGNGTSRTLSVSAAANRSGTATITVRASDGQGNSTAPLTVKVGSDSTDTLGGTPGADIIFGKNGANTTTGQGGNDLLCGGNGSDSMSGGSGDDTLDGANGNDTLRGNAGRDILRGSAGDDKLAGGTEADNFDGGSGTDAATDYNAAEGDVRTNIP